MSNDTTSPDEGDDGRGDEGSDAVEPADDEATDVETAEEPAAEEGAEEAALAERAAHLDRLEDRLDQREEGLDKRADDLRERAEELDEREAEVRERVVALDDREATLDEREAQIEAEEADIEERKADIAERESELSEVANELERKEQTLQTYVVDQMETVEESLDDSVRDVVKSSMAKYSPRKESSRLGVIGNVLLTLVGVTLVGGGVLNLLAADTGAFPTLVASSAGNLAVSALLIFIGLATSLAAAANKV